jgi:hypothetical protein
MQGLPLNAIAYLVATTGAIRNNDGVRPFAYGWKQIDFCHLH